VRTTAEPKNVNGSPDSIKELAANEIGKDQRKRHAGSEAAAMRMNTSRMTIAITLLRNAPSAMRMRFHVCAAWQRKP